MKTKIGKMLNVFFCFLVLIGAAIFSTSVSLKQDAALAVDSTDDEPTLRVLNSDEQKLCSDDEKAKELKNLRKCLHHALARADITIGSQGLFGILN